MKNIIVLSLFALVTTSLGFAESTDCTNPAIVLPDGRTTQSNFPANTTFWFGFFGMAGHSYSVEFVPTTDNAVGTGKVQLSSFGVWGPNDVLTSCRGSSTLTLVPTQGSAPAISTIRYGSGKRLSLIVQTSGMHLISIANGAAGSGPYFFRVVDTTMFAPRWSTYSGYDTQWGIMNVSDMLVQGTLTVFSANNQVINSYIINVPAGQLVMHSSVASDMNLPRNSSGYVIFAHTGPPTAIMADSYMLNGNATTVINAKFETHGTQ